MKINTRHHTSYSFDEAVSLEPHVVRLRPRADASIRVLDFTLEIDPAPIVRAENLDLEGNVVTRAWFEEATDHLSIRAQATVDTLVTDPFHFLIAEPERMLPYAYSPARGQRLSHYRRPPDAAPPSVREVALAAARAVSRNQANFPFALVQQMRRDFSVDKRHRGSLRSPEETVEAAGGTSRDLALLFVECCRAMGLAARFVSGYALGGEEDKTALHAWGEVYLIGGGWRGYDPSLGVACADRHVTLAAAADPADAASIDGSFSGPATATRETLVEVELDGAQPS